MSAGRFTAVFALIGVLVASSLNAIWSLFERSIHAGHYYFQIFKGTLLLFPASIGTMAISGANYWDSDHIVLIGANGILYAIVGILVWLGLRQHKAFFAPVLLLAVALVVGVCMLH